MSAPVVPVRGLPAAGRKFADTAEMTTGYSEILLHDRARSARTTRLDLDLAIRHTPPELVFLWWRRWDSNPRPPACKAGALATELRPQATVRRPLILSRWPFPFCVPLSVFTPSHDTRYGSEKRGDTVD